MWRAAAVRRDDWKLIRIAEDPLSKSKKMFLPLMLIDLKNDPAETTNVADKHPEVAKDLLTALENWEKGLAPPRWYDGSDWEYWADLQIRNHNIENKDYSQ
jgi:arylsulfatase A-like enzyme